MIYTILTLCALLALQDPSLTPEANTAYLTIAANTVHPYARGSVHVNTTNPSGYPIIDPNYLGFTKFGVQMYTTCMVVRCLLLQQKPRPFL